MAPKPKPHESESCLCRACLTWHRETLEAMDLRTRAQAEQMAQEDQQLFNALDRIAREGF